MSQRIYKEQELKLTAILYATRQEVVDYLHKKGRLPKRIEPGGFPIAARILRERRGPDPVLSEVELEIFDAILRERRLPGGSVLLIGDQCEEIAEKRKPLT